MIKIIYFLILTSILFAKVDYSSMSTEELLAMMGYVSPKNKVAFESELKQRVATMSKKEKMIYIKNLKKKR